MIKINIVILPDGKKKTGQIDPAASFERIRTDMARALKLTPPEDYDIFIAPKNKKEPLQNYVPTSGDTIAIIKNEYTGESTVLVDE